MFKKEEASRLKKEFWTRYGFIMKKQLSADGNKINWINYNTKIKNVLFKTDADHKTARISIVLNPADEGVRELYYEQMLELKSFLRHTLEEDWIWNERAYSEHGKPEIHVFTEMRGKSIYNKEDWPDIISFFKLRLIKLDQFWSMARYTFEELV